MKNLILIPIFLLTLSSAFAQNMPATADQAAIKNIISEYAKSINMADAEMGSKLFLNSDRMSFVFPKGYTKGWESTKNNFYGYFAKAFNKRELTIYNENIQVYDNMAVAVFYWKFNAIKSVDNTPQEEGEGRETQVFSKIDGQWKIVHVHYSEMPPKAE